jgi:putative flippase GtrA
MMSLRAMAWRPVKHMLSSAFCTFLDYGLYVLLLAVCSPAVSYVGARLCSAAVNYQLSRRVVFHGRPSALSALEYGMLVIVCMVLGSLGVTVLSGCTWAAFRQSSRLTAHCLL